MSKKNRIFCWDDGVSLKEYFELRISDIDKSTKLAAETLEKRLEGMNEFRAQLEKQTGTFLTKENFESRLLLVDSKLDALQKIVYIGLGGVLVLEVLLRFLIK